MKVNEVFYSLQGEGSLTGTPMVFVRFSNCNLRCSVKNVGFDCDTEFQSGRETTFEELFDRVDETWTPVSVRRPQWILLTGGEPALQIDAHFVELFHERGWKLAIETNGTCELPEGLDFVTVSPKTALHTLRAKRADEVKFVRRAGQELPAYVPDQFGTRLISPAFEPDGSVKKETLEWCIELAKRTPSWKVSLQTHKLLGIR